VVAIGHWQGSREPGPKVQVSRLAADGTALGITVAGPDAVEDAIRALDAG
jgi:hypothetical protein